MVKTEYGAVRYLAPEDIRSGQYVAVGHFERSYFYCTGESFDGRPPYAQAVYKDLPEENELKVYEVLAVNVPFVLLRTVTNEHELLDARQTKLVELDPEFGQLVFIAIEPKKPRKRKQK
ncbi:MAG: hypothetical protein AAFR38_14955 [Planctomycetota bacterium]